MESSPGTCKACELANISLSVETEDKRPAMVCSDVDGLDVIILKHRFGDGVARGEIGWCQNIVILNSPILKDVAATEAK